MKKTWEEPKILVQKFVANEYVAACGEENEVYSFSCDAPAGKLYYYPNDTIIDGVGTGSAEKLGNYTPCGKTHEARVNSDFYDGFVDYNSNRKRDDGEAVIVWLEFDKWGFFEDAHATTQLDKNSWTTSKS